MQPQFVDRMLLCSDCHSEFIFTAGEQLFFSDKQFKNDPKRCKPCKSRRSGLSAAANGQTGPAAAGISRTETRTECSECGLQTTVPFKPTQGRPVLCRQCFQARGRSSTTPRPAEGATMEHMPDLVSGDSETAAALTGASANGNGMTLSASAALLAATAMAGASAMSSVASMADLASITQDELVGATPNAVEDSIPAALVAATPDECTLSRLLVCAAEPPDA